MYRKRMRLQEEVVVPHIFESVLFIQEGAFLLLKLHISFILDRSEVGLEDSLGVDQRVDDGQIRVWMLPTGAPDRT